MRRWCLIACVTCLTAALLSATASTADAKGKRKPGGIGSAKSLRASQVLLNLQRIQSNAMSMARRQNQRIQQANTAYMAAQKSAAKENAREAQRVEKKKEAEQAKHRALLAEQRAREAAARERSRSAAANSGK